MNVYEAVRWVAASAPDAVAVSGADGTTTYAELVGVAQALADALRRSGVRAGDVVGLSVRRSHVPAGVLGVMAAGAAYLPLDQSVPTATVVASLKECDVRVVLTDEPDSLVAHPGLRAVGYESSGVIGSASDAGAPPCRAPEHIPANDSLAYVIATSGTTRRPKFVAVGHRGLAAFTDAIRHSSRLTPADRVLQFHTVAFDAAAEEIFPTLVAGATIVTVDPAPAPQDLLDIVQREHVTVLDLPTSYWHQLATEPPATLVARLSGVRLVIIGGEGAATELVSKWLTHVGVPLVNSYGVTEATVTSTWNELDGSEDLADVPIGYAIHGTTVQILDEDLCPLPSGAAGELCVGGAGAAWGYLGEPGLTADRFRPDPYAATPGSRLYRTGDACTSDTDGRLHFVGRQDLEVKVRGYRLNLVAIETELTAVPGVVGAVVVPSERIDGQLVAYLATDRVDTAVTVTEVRRHAEERLPTQAVPHLFRFVRAFPLTSHGKVDRQAIAAREQSHPAETSTSSLDGPQSTATRLTQIWSSVLGLQEVSSDTNFFEAGGHSLMAFRILGHVRNHLGVDIPARTLFDAPRLGDFTRHVEALVVATPDLRSFDK